MAKYTLSIPRLIECRTQMGFSKMEAAKQIGVSQPAYLRYETGERTPSIQVINEIARVFQTTPDYLLGKSASQAVDTYVIQKRERPELFSIVEKYYHSDKQELTRLLTYIEHFK